MRRGDIYWVQFEPSIGGEIRKMRPAVIISNDAANAVMNRVQVVPLSSRVEKLYPCEALMHVQGKRSKAMADQVATISKTRLRGHLGRAYKEEMMDIERALRLQLAL